MMDTFILCSLFGEFFIFKVIVINSEYYSDYNDIVINS